MRIIGLIVFCCTMLSSVAALAAELSAESTAFLVRSYPGGPAPVEILDQCQSTREQLEKTWFGTTKRESWDPCCEIVLHGTRASYIRAIGQSGFQSFGSSLIRSDGQKIIKRRIDLLANANRQFSALTHELTHVILADRFATDHPPLWANEGIATLADSASKRSLHQRDCMAAMRTGTSFRINDLLEMDQLRSSCHVPAFYGQSLSLVQFLVERDEPSKFVPFLELAMERGYDRALREVYDIDGVAHLETLWRDFIVSGDATGTRITAHISAGG